MAYSRKLGAINGGFYPRTKANQQTKVTILVDDIQQVMKKAKAAGAKFQPGAQGGEVDEVPGVGHLQPSSTPWGTS